MILVAMLIGGGAAQGLWSDHIIEILLVPALFFGLSGAGKSRLGIPARILVLCTFALLLAQFIPFQRPLPDVAGLLERGTSPAFSRDIGNSLEAALFAVGVLGFFLYLSKFSTDLLERLPRFMLVGFFVNFAVMVVQLSFDKRIPIGNILPFEITAGLFGNQNHASTLIYCIIPVFAYLFIARNRRLVIYVGLIALVVAVLTAQGSRAGMGISAGLGVLCFAWFLAPQSSWLVRSVQFLAAGLVVVFIVLLPFNPDWLGDDPRSTTFVNTMQAVKAYWPYGSGLGTFINIYPAFEPIANVDAYYVNHAHSDYLELMLEGGAMALILIAAFLMLVLKNMYRTPFSSAAGIAILSIAIHSAVDYPLRTFGIAILVAFFAAVVLSQSSMPLKSGRRSAQSELSS